MGPHQGSVRGDYGWRRKGTEESTSSLASRQAVEMEGWLNSRQQERLQGRRRPEDALGLAEGHSSGS